MLFTYVDFTCQKCSLFFRTHFTAINVIEFFCSTSFVLVSQFSDFAVKF